MRAKRALIAFTLLLACPAFGQTPRLEELLPADTSFYLLWRGDPSPQAGRNVNSLLRLWNDPDFAPVRSYLRERLATEITKNSKPGAWSREEAGELSSLLENPLVLGYAGEWKLGPPSESGSVSGAKKDPAGGFFLIFDATGKRSLVDQLEQRWTAEGLPGRSVSRLGIGATTVDKIVGPDGTHYRAIVGNDFVQTDSPELMESLIGRLRATAPIPESLRETPSYRAARKEIGGEPAAEFFVRIPNFPARRVAPAAGFDPLAFAHALRLNQVHVLCGGVSFAEQATRLRFSILGDTSSGSLFDILGESSADFATLPAAPAAASYTVGRFDYAALNEVVVNALAASLPAETAARLALLQGVFFNQLARVLAGESATIYLGPGPSAGADLYVFSIRQRDELLHLVHGALAPMIAGEEQEGNTTYLSLATPYTDPKTQAERKHFYTIAIAPQVAVAGPHSAAVHEAMARLAAPAAAGTLAADPKFARARARLPGKLSVLSYSDLAQMDWGKFVNSLLQGMAKGAAAPQDAAPSGEEWLKQFNPAMLSRYLHVTASGWWKDRDGVHSDTEIE